MPNKNNLSYRVGELEKKMKDIGLKLDDIRTNDLHHLDKRIVSLESQVKLLSAINVGALIIHLIIAKYF